LENGRRRAVGALFSLLFSPEQRHDLPVLVSQQLVESDVESKDILF
jgi:hypothetical protein